MGELVFETETGCLFQSDEKERFYLTMTESLIEFRPCELIAFKRKLNQVDMANLLSATTPDIEIISLPSCDRIFALSIHDVLALRELVNGAFTMLELNSILRRQLTDPISTFA